MNITIVWTGILIQQFKQLQNGYFGTRDFIIAFLFKPLTTSFYRDMEIASDGKIIVSFLIYLPGAIKQPCPFPFIPVSD